MSDTGSALRVTSDAFLADLEELDSLERQKREIQPGDPKLVELAAQVEEVARRLLGVSVLQRELSVVAQDEVEDGEADAPDAPISRTPREIHLILADWRNAERIARDAKPGSAEALKATADLDRYRDEYRSAHDAARDRS